LGWRLPRQPMIWEVSEPERQRRALLSLSAGWDSLTPISSFTGALASSRCGAPAASQRRQGGCRGVLDALHHKDPRFQLATLESIWTIIRQMRSLSPHSMTWIGV